MSPAAVFERSRLDDNACLNVSKPTEVPKAETRRLVERGLNKIHGLDFEETLSVSRSLHGFVQSVSFCRFACSDRTHLKHENVSAEQVWLQSLQTNRPIFISEIIPLFTVHGRRRRQTSVRSYSNMRSSAVILPASCYSTVPNLPERDGRSCLSWRGTSDPRLVSSLFSSVIFDGCQQLRMRLLPRRQHFPHWPLSLSPLATTSGTRETSSMWCLTHTRKAIRPLRHIYYAYR